jgi:tRNA(Ile)-lysidine synthase
VADLRARFHAFVAERGLLAPGEAVVVGVSGGVDSVTLLHLLRDGYRPHAVHLHYGLRPEADADAAFVEALGREWGVPVEVSRVTLPERENVQASARAARYRAFEEAAERVGALAVAVGHQRDDVAETLLLNLVRGSGPRGWAALPALRPISPGSAVRVVRPLRFAHRPEIEAFARAEGLRWREDATNATDRYRRNLLRQRVMPLLKHINPEASAHLASAAEELEAYRTSGAALSALGDFESVRLGSDALALEPLANLPPPARRGVLFEALRQWAPEVSRTAATVREVERLLEDQVGRRAEFGGTTVWRERDRIRFAPPLAEAFAVSVEGGRGETPWGTLTLEPLAALPQGWDRDPNVEVADADRLSGPLELRTWRPGDRLRPLGMEGEKRVSDLLTDQQVPPSERFRQLVLTAGGEVAWVVGHRLAEGFRVGEGTRRAVRMRWSPGG